MECPYCKATNRDGVRFCSNCGRQMPPQVSASSVSQSSGASSIPGKPGSSSSLTAGSQLQNGRYTIKGVLGQGGMGAALLATDKRLDNKRVVIKELLSDSSNPKKQQEDEANFQREVRTLAHLDHPLIPNVTDHFDENGRFFMVQEYVEGENLEDYLDRTKHPLSEREALFHASEILDVLEYLTQQKPPIVHRDIKPANIVIGAKDRKAHLVDFGIARADVARNAQRKQTSALGTPGYAPPEQYQGNAGPRSDLYALGATLHHLLSNRDPRNYPPFIFPDLRTLNAQLSPDIERVITRALNNDPSQRYQTASAFKHDVDDILYRRFGVVGYRFSGVLDDNLHPPAGSSPQHAPFAQPAHPAGNPVLSHPQTPLPPVAAGISTPPHGLVQAPYQPVGSPHLPGTPLPAYTAPASSRHMGRNIFLVLLALLVVGGLIYGGIQIGRRSSPPTLHVTPTTGVATVPATQVPDTGLGVTKAASGEYIGISDGSFAFDTGRPDGALKQQAATALKAGNLDQARGYWQQAIAQESNDAEALIYQENQQVLAAGGFHVTLVVATMLTGANVGVGRDDLQGAYVAQKTWNDGAQLNGIGIVLLIANAGSQNTNADVVSRQIAQAAQRDASIIGVIGWPYSSYATRSIDLFKSAHLPVVSPTASSDLLTAVSPYFFRVCPANKAQGVEGAKYMEDKLKAHNVVVFSDPLDAYSSSLANDFTAQFKADGNTVIATENYTVGKSQTVVTALNDALKLSPDAIYFAGYASDVSVLLTDLPTTGPQANLQVMGGDALYELSSYQSSARAVWKGRLHFTSFASPDAWDVLGYKDQKPAFFDTYSADFNTGQNSKPDGTYGFTRADSDIMLSYDATVAMLQAARNTGKSSMTSADIEQSLTQLHDAHAIQGVSGQIAFGQDGDPIDKAIVVLQVTLDGTIQMENTIGGKFLL